MENYLLAQYEGTLPVGEVLGENTSGWGIPSWILILIALLLTFFIFFLAFKRRRKESKSK